MAGEVSPGTELQTICQFFEIELAETAPDSEIQEYLLAAAKEEDDIDTVIETFLSFSQNLVEKPVAEQTVLVLKLQQQLHQQQSAAAALATAHQQHENQDTSVSGNTTTTTTKQPTTTATTTTTTTTTNNRAASALVEAFSRLNTLNSSSTDSDNSSNGDTHSTTSSTTTCQADKPPTIEEQEAIAMLHQLCCTTATGKITDRYLLYILRTCSGGSLESAAIHITDPTIDLLSAQTTWENLETKRKTEREAERTKLLAAKKNVVQRFALQAISDRPSTAPIHLPTTTGGSSSSSKGGGGGESKVRYRDGQVVSTKGEKFIVVKEKEEWDGGSRGRVKSKRKGGVGWH